MKRSIHDESSMSNASDETPEGIAYYFICLLLSIFREYYLIFFNISFFNTSFHFNKKTYLH